VCAGWNPEVDTTGTDGTVAGSWLGLWHGIIAPVLRNAGRNRHTRPWTSDAGGTKVPTRIRMSGDGGTCADDPIRGGRHGHLGHRTAAADGTGGGQ
jgi:hypothetical protein